MWRVCHPAHPEGPRGIPGLSPWGERNSSHSAILFRPQQHCHSFSSPAALSGAKIKVKQRSTLLCVLAMLAMLAMHAMHATHRHVPHVPSVLALYELWANRVSARSVLIVSNTDMLLCSTQVRHRVCFVSHLSQFQSHGLSCKAPPWQTNVRATSTLANQSELQ